VLNGFRLKYEVCATASAPLPTQKHSTYFNLWVGGRAVWVGGRADAGAYLGAGGGGCCLGTVIC